MASEANATGPRKERVGEGFYSKQFVEKVVTNCSENYYYHYTRKQLEHEYVRLVHYEKTFQTAPWAAAVWLGAIVTAAILPNNLHKLYVVLGAGAFHGLLYMLRSFQFSKVHPDLFWEAHKTYRVYPEFQKLLLNKPNLEKDKPKYPELIKGGYKRVLICQQNIMVDFLVRNGFHEECNTLVVSESGYPAAAQEKLEHRITTRKTRLPIWLLHNADEKGEAMLDRIRNRGLFADYSDLIRSMGMCPEDMELAHFPKKWRIDESVQALPPHVLYCGLRQAITSDRSIYDLRSDVLIDQLQKENK
ncbi:MAG: hypothetical protein ACLFQ6_05885 [Candidatus Sumerlaeia bacterium]